MFKDVVEQSRLKRISKSHLVQSYCEAEPAVVLDAFLIAVLIARCLMCHIREKQWL